MYRTIREIRRPILVPLWILEPLVGCPEENSFNQGAVSARVRPGGKGNDEEWKEAARESREDLFLYANKPRGRGNGTSTTCRVLGGGAGNETMLHCGPWRAVNPGQRMHSHTRHMRASRPPVRLQYLDPCHFLFVVPKSTGDFAYRSRGLESVGSGSIVARSSAAEKNSQDCRFRITNILEWHSMWQESNTIKI